MTNQSSKPGVSVYRLDIDAELPLTTLIASRLTDLGLTKAGVARRMGYVTTTEKGVRRLEALLAGDLRKYGNLKGPLAKGLDLDEAVLDKTVSDTRYVLWARDDREYRGEFVPHVIWSTEFWVPRPIAIAGMVGAWRALYFYPTSANPMAWSEEAVASRPPGLPCYGTVRGFWVNYSPDCAVRFNIHGEPEEVLGQAVRPGVPSASIGSRPTNWAEVTRSRSETLQKVDWSLL